MTRLRAREVVLVVLVLVALMIVVVLLPLWLDAVNRNRDARADPHHIAGDLYFVGTPDLASFLILGDDGHVLIGGGAASAAHKIADNITQLGFDIADVRALLATDPHADEAGGLRELQRLSGADVWASGDNADVIERGGKADPSVVYIPYRLLAGAGMADFEYDAPRVEHRVGDGETIHVGSLAFTAHITPGHAPGCTTWTFMVKVRDRDLRVVHRCGLDAPAGASFVKPERYPGIRADFERSFRALRNLPVDIWLTSHGREYGRYRKYEESRRAEDAVAPFIDPTGYLEAIDAAEAKYRALLPR